MVMINDIELNDHFDKKNDHITSSSRTKLIFQRLLRNKLAVFGMIVLILMTLCAFIVPYFLPYSPTYIDQNNLATPPSWNHLFGTNLIGQDVLAQTLSGLQKSLVIAFSVAIISTTIAGTLGAIAGYFRGKTDNFIMFFTDILLIVPTFLIISIANTKFRNGSYLYLVFFLSAFTWMISARMVRSVTMTLREREYVKAAKYMGAGPFKIIFRHILPNMASILIADVTLNIGYAVTGEAALSYFGFGVQPPNVSLGTLIASGSNTALSFPWTFLFCCGCLTLLVLASNFVGDGLRDAFDATI